MLLAIPALVAWYAGQQRGRRRAAAAFAPPQLAASVTPHRPGWRRQAPLLAFLLALAILILQNGRRPPSAIVLLSDGKTTTGSDPVAVASGAGKLRIPIHNRAGRGSEISASFAIGGLILLLSAGVASQRWAGRLP